MRRPNDERRFLRELKSHRRRLERQNQGFEYDLPGPAAGFVSDEAVIDGALKMFSWRARLMDGGNEDKESRDLIVLHEERWRKWWHESLSLSSASSIAELMRKHELSSTETEIIVALVVDRLGQLDHEEIRQCSRLQKFFRRTTGALQLLSMVDEGSRLYRNELIFHDDVEEELPERNLIINPMIMDQLLHPSSDSNGRAGWDISTEQDLHRQLKTLTYAMKRRAEIIDIPFSSSRLMNLRFRVSTITRRLSATLDQHPEWKISSFFEDNSQLKFEERLIIVVLMGRELGHLQGDDDLFTGRGLAGAVSDIPGSVEFNLELLRPNSTLMMNDIIRPYLGSESMLAGSDEDLATTEYELTDSAREKLGIERKMIMDRSSRFQVRKPQIAMSQMVLSERIQTAISMAVAQVRNSCVLLDKWGLGESIVYGRGVTLLFSGPPGTGKTACAEAIAHELQAPILVADYSMILNCLIGNTEKALVRIFREAREQKAVLFWDEADAMFYNRDKTNRTFEVQFANVLLSELEHFEGVCILATNRKIALDPALGRRVSLKIDFERPNYEERCRIWRTLMPEKLPLADDVDLEELARPDLSGGEIKNVIFNAARTAVMRDTQGPLTRSDFESATRFEIEGRLESSNARRIGFQGDPDCN